MLTCRKFFITSLLVALALTGCHDHQSGQATRTPEAISSTMPSAMFEDSSGSTPDELAKRTAAYAHNVSAMLNGHAQTTTNSTQPSLVKWVEPTPPEHAANEPVTTQPSQAKTAPKQQSAAVLAAQKTAPDSGDPLILPESADGMGNGSRAVHGPTDDYERKLAQQVHDYPRDLGNQLDYELLRFVRDEQTPDLQAISQLPAEDRELLAAVLDGLNNLRNTSRQDSNPMLARKIQPLLDMADRLRSQAELTIPTAALCTSVERYGVYTPVESTRFGAGKPIPVVVYCEVNNFTSIMNDQKMWQTRLSQEMVLYSETGLRIWPEKSNTQLYVDMSHTRRHDFFVARKIMLPANLSMSRYLLKVTLTDEQSNRVAESTIPFEIVAE